MKPISIASVVIMAVILAGTSGCKRREDPMGPAQKAGAAIDNAGDKVAQQLHEQLNKADQAAKEMAEAAKATGDKINDATGDASRGLDHATEEVGKKVERAGEKIQDAAHDK